MVHAVGDTVELSVDDSFADYESRPGSVIFSPESRVMRAWYNHYVFSTSDFATAWRKTTSDGQVEVKVLDVQKSIHGGAPGDASPQGGIKNFYYNVALA
jgi:hypothetical protein